ncbi:GNAT family N-acetyltransferase [Rhodobacterales bacterium HKCCE2091]|nr:GNAT family N-acetyltransferase [Rhodobacterales bacterium HKCCE2091]
MTPQVEIDPADFSDWSGLHALLVAAFAHMDGGIDPPSSLSGMDPQSLAAKAREDHFLLVRDTAPIGCLFCTEEAGALYLSKWAVAPERQGRGLGLALLEAAESLARARGLPGLRLQTRIELTGNHRAFRALGFRLSGSSRHNGYDRATSFEFRKQLA